MISRPSSDGFLRLRRRTPKANRRTWHFINSNEWEKLRFERVSEVTSEEATFSPPWSFINKQSGSRTSQVFFLGGEWRCYVMKQICGSSIENWTMKVSISFSLKGWSVEAKKPTLISPWRNKQIFPPPTFQEQFLIHAKQTNHLDGCNSFSSELRNCNVSLTRSHDIRLPTYRSSKINFSSCITYELGRKKSKISLWLKLKDEKLCKTFFSPYLEISEWDCRIFNVRKLRPQRDSLGLHCFDQRTSQSGKSCKTRMRWSK